MVTAIFALSAVANLFAGNMLPGLLCLAIAVAHYGFTRSNKDDAK